MNCRHADWLGSARFSSTPSRTMYNDLAYAPSGEQYAAAGTTGVTNTSFARSNEDTVSNLYDAYFREYGIQGRWPSPDPAGIAAANPLNPQSWNRYAYALNNPNNFIDPAGLCTDTATIVCVTASDDNAIPADLWPLVFGAPAWDSGGGDGGSGGGGNLNNLPLPNISPNISALAPPPPCMVLDPIFSGLEYTGKFGPGLQIGPFKAGFSFYDNFTSGQTGAKGELNLGIIGIEGDVPTPPGGSLNGDQPTQWTISAFGFQKNLTTGTPWQFNPARSFGKWGLQVFAGIEVSENTQTMNQQARANEACIASGGAIW